jgi:hypothetical protein
VDIQDANLNTMTAQLDAIVALRQDKLISPSRAETLMEQIRSNYELAQNSAIDSHFYGVAAQSAVTFKNLLGSFALKNHQGFQWALDFALPDDPEL